MRSGMRASEICFCLAVTIFCAFGTVFRLPKDQDGSSLLQDTTTSVRTVQVTAEPEAPASVVAAAKDIVCPKVLKDTLFVIYNRLGKCGSSSTSKMLSKLGKRNNFQLEDSNQYGVQLADRLTDPALVRALYASATDRPALYVNHVWYFGDIYDIAPQSPRPVYIQMVREPISRVISQFYFLTAPRRDATYRTKMKQLQTEAGFFIEKGDLDDCILNATNPERCERTNEMTSYFCGYVRECANPASPEALKMATANLENYAFVGILEDFQTTVAMFEKLLPRYFEGASSIVVPHENEARSNKKAPSAHTLDMLRKYNANDLVLYQLIVEKFDRQAKACLGVSSSLRNKSA
mmetsp:Transcript_22624/g.33577  ORF Transcript_22624/g.33577 Transcript_22624/m.33577 type:complete len:350 (-) Transcript_22624:520-1569(-)